MASVAVVDSGGTNINSVLFALERLGAPAKLTADPAEIVLPVTYCCRVSAPPAPAWPSCSRRTSSPACAACGSR